MPQNREGYLIEPGNAAIEFPLDDDPTLYLPQVEDKDEVVPIHCQFATALFMYGMENAAQIMDWFHDKLRAERDGAKH